VKKQTLKDGKMFNYVPGISEKTTT